jgi:hypothetical protein
MPFDRAHTGAAGTLPAASPLFEAAAPRLTEIDKFYFGMGFFF